MPPAPAIEKNPQPSRREAIAARDRELFEREQERRMKMRAQRGKKLYVEQPIAAEDRRECGPEIAELEEVFAFFEEDHPHEALLAVTGPMTYEEVKAHPVREPARQALDPVVRRLDALKRETNISFEEHLRLETRYKKLSKAVGFLRGDLIVHEDR